MSAKSEFDIAVARETLQQCIALRRQRLEVMVLRAQEDFCRIKEMLIAKYHPRRIYQWGSLLRPEKFQEISDIDIALEGLDNSMAGLHALDDACRLTNFPVDLVEMERIHPSHAQSIREEGRLVYEHKA